MKKMFNPTFINALFTLFLITGCGNETPFLPLNKVLIWSSLLLSAYTLVLFFLLKRNIKSASLIKNYQRTVSDKTEELRIINLNMDSRILKITEDIDREKERTIEQNRILNDLNKSLTERINSATNELRDKNDLMIHSSRQASMGEMIGFMGHQWKQSIYAISLYSEALKNILKQKGSLDVDTAREPLEKIDSFIIEMYDTMNDLAGFMKNTSDVEYFSIADVIEATLKLMKDFITINSVEIIRDYRGEVYLTGFSNEMKQVVMNIIKNAIDAFNENGIKDRIIAILVNSSEEMNFMSINDNAGGIPFDNTDVVFDKFYTSKDDGTGLGLYLSRIIIEQRFGGKIEVRNKEGGASFTISIPVFTEDTVL